MGMRELGVLSLERRRLHGDLRAPSSAQRGSRRVGEGLGTRAWSDRTRGNGFTLPEDRVRWDIGKEFLVVRVGSPWHRVPRAAVAAPFLAVSKARLDRAWSNLG